MKKQTEINTRWSPSLQLPYKQCSLQYAHAPSPAGQLLSVQLDLSHALILGRSDFTVKSMDAVAGQQKWNVSYAQVQVLTAAQPACMDAASPGVAVANAKSGRHLPVTAAESEPCSDHAGVHANAHASGHAGVHAQGAAGVGAGV